MYLHVAPLLHPLWLKDEDKIKYQGSVEAVGEEADALQLPESVNVEPGVTSHCLVGGRRSNSLRSLVVRIEESKQNFAAMMKAGPSANSVEVPPTDRERNMALQMRLLQVGLVPSFHHAEEFQHLALACIYHHYCWITPAHQLQVAEHRIVCGLKI